MKCFYCGKHLLLGLALAFMFGCEDEQEAWLEDADTFELRVEENEQAPEVPYEDEGFIAEEEAEAEEVWEGFEEGEEPVAVAAAASVSFPSLSTSAYAAGYCRSTTNNTPVYTSSSVNIRGTSSPYQAYAATVYAADEVYVYSINATSAYISYPVGSTRRYGYLRTSDLSAANFGENITAKASATTYRRPSGASYGSIYVGDTVRAVASVSGYVQVFYTAKSGSRAWKIGYVTQAAYNSMKGSTTAPPVASSWQYPMSGYTVSLGWGGINSSKPANRNRHVALDLYGNNTNIFAAASGTVAAVGTQSENGNFVVLSHTLSGSTVYSFYAHLKSRPNLSKGQGVSKGQIIGVMGRTGGGNGGGLGGFGEHLHFSIMDRLDSGGAYYGYTPAFSGNKTTYMGTTFYNPAYVIQNGKLP